MNYCLSKIVNTPNCFTFHSSPRPTASHIENFTTCWLMTLNQVAHTHMYVRLAKYTLCRLLHVFYLNQHLLLKSQWGMNHRPITSISNLNNDLKRGLVVLTHQLLSSRIIEYNWVSCIMDVIGRYFTPCWPFTISITIHCYVSSHVVGSNETLLLTDMKYVSAEQYT